MKKPERASQIWTVLAWAAKNRQTLTYGHLSKLIGVPTVGLGQLLDPIYLYCRQEELPPLTILVVQQDSGLPGPGFPEMNRADHARAYMEVYEYDWLERGNPQPEGLEQAMQ